MQISIIVLIKQSSDGVTYAHKLTKAEGKINWHESAYKIDCKIRGMNPWPGAYFSYNDKIIKILKAEYLNADHHFTSGTVISDKLEIACGSGILRVKILQQEGKRALPTSEFLHGTNILKGVILE